MTFYELFKNDIDKLSKRYSYFETIPVADHIVELLKPLNIDIHTKCAILAIDTSMRMQSLVNDFNKDKYVLSTDLLSALFYRYLSTPYLQRHYQILTSCVAKQNELKQLYAETGDESLIQAIDLMFVTPFISK